MTISTELKYESIENLYLDPQNPRLGRHLISQEPDQEALLEEMRTWKLDELAWSYLESGGFWTHEALIVVEEPPPQERGVARLVVVEGNRRLAALKWLQRAVHGAPISRAWKEMVESFGVPPDLFEQVPYFLTDSRADVKEFLGFRHVTGIKQWDADEKAGFIAHLIDDHGLSYREVMRKIGSTTPAVRQHYVAFRVMLQMEEQIEEFDPKEVGKRFAILYMLLKTSGAQEYLQIDAYADPEKLKPPVARDQLERLRSFYRWVYGTEESESIVRDTRRVADFSQVLESEEAVEYLESADEPNLEIAHRISGGDEQETLRHINEAANHMELALQRAHAFKGSEEIRRALRRLGEDALALLNLVPKIKRELFEKDLEE